MSKFDELVSIINERQNKKLNAEELKKKQNWENCEKAVLEFRNKIKLLLENTKLEDQITKSTIDYQGRIVTSGHINIVEKLLSLHREFFEKYDELGKTILYKDNPYMRNQKYPYLPSIINKACPEFLEWCTNNGIKYSSEEWTFGDYDSKTFTTSYISKL